ncbi:nuclear transport factor 2 family protein [Actinomadura rubrisoli]|uniref:Nuclear transport factor 2 family protein n=1 Tax=Actinomadura rubrisoli TaxID=2530368 RepID=A0A4R5AQX8_9ACTN|nr:nuclear transport factor 2 family protein [Actinomadura rubrisoli]TDD73464.1 nuclear transport factor 2 family protein [Actinomadura rubrisoli]
MAPPLSADLYVEVQTFYARQMRALDSGKLEDFAQSFTEDGVMRHVSRDDHVQGREAILAMLRAGLPAYDGFIPRHWFDKFLIETVDADTVRTDYYAMVTMTDAKGTVVLQPTCVVEDELVRVDGTLLLKSRVIRRDDLLLR